MSRSLSRRKFSEGRGFGERLSEYLVYILAVAAIAYGVNWYLKVYLPSPSNVLSKYLAAVNDGRPENQYPLLSSSTVRFFKSADDFGKRWPTAIGLAAKIPDFTISNMTVNGDKAEADVTLVIRRGGQELYQASTDKYKDHYLLVHEGDAWKIALDQSQDKLESLKAARTFK